MVPISWKFEILKLEVINSDLEKGAVRWNPNQNVHIQPRSAVHWDYIQYTMTCYCIILGMLVPNSWKFGISKLEVMNSALEKVEVGWNPNTMTWYFNVLGELGPMS